MELHDIFPPLATFSWPTLTLIFGILTLTWWHVTRRSDEAPGPWRLPLVGSIPFLPSGSFLDATLKMQKKYGNVFQLYIANRRVYSICGLDTIKEALIKKGSVFSARPRDFIQEIIGDKSGLISTNGAVQQTQKRFTLHALRNHGFGKSTMDDMIQSEVTELMSELEKETGRRYKPSLLFKKATSNVINLIAFGQRHSYQDPNFIRSLQLVERLFEMIGPKSLLPLFPWLRFVPGDPFGHQEFVAVNVELQAYYLKWIREHKERMATGDTPSDFIGQYLMEIEKHKDDPDTQFTEKHLLHTIGDLFLAGTDTSSSTMNWIVLYLVTYPELQEKIFQEIRDNCGVDHRPAWSARSSLPVTEAFIAEVLRRSSVAPFTLPHTVTEDTTLEGYHIPKGSFIAVCTYSVDMDPSIWHDPEAFRPDRFLTPEGKFQKRDESILFSLGKRSCVGEGLARNEIFTFTTSLIQKFRMRLPEGDPEPSTEGTDGGIRNPHPFDIVLEIRDQSTEEPIVNI